MQEGELWTDGNRLFKVTGVNKGVVVYEDHYEDHMEERITSAIQWEVDSNNNAIWKVGE